MKAPIVTTKNLYLQKDFAPRTELWLKGLFGAADNEKLLCAVWISPLTRQGFLLTDRGLRWYLPGEEEPISGLLLHEIAPHADFAVSGSEAFLRIEITAAGGSYAFFFKNLAEEKGRTLCDILRFGYLQGTVPQVDLSVLIKNMPCTAFRNRLDGALLALAALPEKRKHKAKAAAARQEQASGAQGQEKPENAAAAAAGAETAAGSRGAGPGADADSRQGDQAEATDAADTRFTKPDFFGTEEPGSEKTAASEVPRRNTSTATVILFICDIIASLLFLAACFVKAKEGMREFPSRYSYLISYAALRLALILFSKTGLRRILSVLLVLLLIVSNMVILTVLPYSIFVLFCGILYFCLEYSLGMRTKAILIKLELLIILGFVLYLSMLATSNPAVSDAFKSICDALPFADVKLSWSRLLGK